MRNAVRFRSAVRRTILINQFKTPEQRRKVRENSKRKGTIEQARVQSKELVLLSCEELEDDSNDVEIQFQVRK